MISSTAVRREHSCSLGPAQRGILRSNWAPLVISVVVTGIGVVALAWGWYLRTSARAQFLDQQARASSASVDTALETVVSEAMSLVSLLQLNRELMKQYHGITTTQAEDSYFFAKVASILGMTVLIAGAIIALLVSDFQQSVAASLAAVGRRCRDSLGHVLSRIAALSTS